MTMGKGLIRKIRREKEEGKPMTESIGFPLSSFQNHKDPNLKTMTFQLPTFGRKNANGEEVYEEQLTFEAYVQPHISAFYNKNQLSMKPKKPYFMGEAGKFFNLGNEHLSLYWGDGRNPHFIADVRPFQAVGTATFPGHHFKLTTKGNPQNVLFDFHVVPDKNLYVYDPYYHEASNTVSLDKLENDLDAKEQKLYWLQRNSLEFGKFYYEFTGRRWLGLYPLRKPPAYRMWNADYFGQEHWVTTKETHYVIEPPEDVLESLSREELHDKNTLNRRHLSEYRQQGTTDEEGDGSYMNMTMTVLSCAPRVFEIKNFLSHVEVDHIVHMATGMKLRLSTTSGSDGHDRRSDTKTRTSKNSWVGRMRSPIIDSIYRRAADLMQIDEALLRNRNKDERPNIDHRGSNAEDLQLVHYEVSEQYTAHHDFSYPDSHNKDQSGRFATLLLYLNEGMEGGETSFPRWMNAKSSQKLSVVPEIGKAVLFYSNLPDGNMDDLSQHAAEPVKVGEKWLINLWTWDPSFR